MNYNFNNAYKTYNANARRKTDKTFQTDRNYSQVSSKTHRYTMNSNTEYKETEKPATWIQVTMHSIYYTGQQEYIMKLLSQALCNGPKPRICKLFLFLPGIQ